MAVTLQMIAQHVGLSKPTVSDVLGKRGHLYSEETRARVTSAARELGYRPNSSAKALSIGKFGCIALVLSVREHHKYLSDGLLTGICDALAEHDLHLTLAQLPDEQFTAEGAMPKLLRQWMADGILINYIVGAPPQLMETVRQYRIPSIWTNCKQLADCVYPDDYEAGQHAVRRLLELGHRRITFVNYSVTQLHEVHYSVTDRQAGYTLAMRKAGLTPRIILRRVECDTDVPLGTLGREDLSSPDRPTALVTYCSKTTLAMAYGALSLGLRVPQDLSIITFSDRLMGHGPVVVDTLTTPETAMGRAAVEMLQEKIAHPDHLLQPRVLPLGYSAGASVAACRP